MTFTTLSETKLGINIEGGTIYTPEALKNIAKEFCPKGHKVSQWHIFIGRNNTHLAVDYKDKNGWVQQKSIVI